MRPFCPRTRRCAAEAGQEILPNQHRDAAADRRRSAAGSARTRGALVVLDASDAPADFVRDLALSGVLNARMHLACLLVLLATPGAFMRYGGGPRAVTGLGDLDGDKCADFAVGRCGQRDGVHPDETWICAGRDGSVLLRIVGERGCERFGNSLARAADLDGDGKRDLALSMPGATGRAGEACCDDHPSGRVRIYSTRDGALLRTIESPNVGKLDQFGWELADAGDCDGDGVADLLIGAPNVDRAYLYSGKDSHLLREFAAERGDGAFGWSVCGAVDLDGDGVPDLAVGAPQWKRRGFVEVFSGRDGTRLRIPEGNEHAHGGRFGASLSMLGDVDGDRRAELLVGADNESYGHVHAYTGVTSDSIFDLSFEDGFSTSRFGTSVAACGDLDGDDSADFFVGDSSATPPDVTHGQACGTVGAYSGKTRRRLFQRCGDETFDMLGTSLANVGDLDGDGVDDVIAESRRYFRAISGKDGMVLYDVQRGANPPTMAPPRERTK